MDPFFAQHQYQQPIPNTYPANQELVAFFNSDQASPPQPIDPFFFYPPAINFAMLSMYSPFDQTMSPSYSFSDDVLSLDGIATPTNDLFSNLAHTAQSQFINTTTTDLAEGHQKIMQPPKKEIVKKSKANRSSKAMMFSCDHQGCDKVFVRKYNLNSHKVTHFVERKFACDKCPKSFARHHDLKRHTRIHTGEVTHQCRYCQRGYGRSDALKRHYITDTHCARWLQSDPTYPIITKNKAQSAGFE